MYLTGAAPPPAEYGFLDLDEPAPRATRTTWRSACSLAVDCANERRIGEDSSVVDGAEVVLDVDHHHDNARFGDVNLIVDDASSTAEIVRDLLEVLDVPLTPEIARGALRRARHRHGPLPVHEHDAEGASPGGRARRGRRRHPRGLPAMSTRRCSSPSSSCSRARSSARSCSRAAGSSSPTSCKDDFGERRRRGAVLRGDHRPPPVGRRVGDGRADPRAAARRGAGAPDLAALELRRGRRLRGRAGGGRRRPPPGSRLLVGALDRRDSLRSCGGSSCSRPSGADGAARAQAGRDRARRQAGRAVVVRARRRAAAPHARAHGPRGHARPVRDGPPAPPLRGRDEARAVLRRARQALRDRDRPDRDDDDGRLRGRDGRAARRADGGRARGRARAACAARSSCRSRRRRP